MAATRDGGVIPDSCFNSAAAVWFIEEHSSPQQRIF
jgi:hypothetical protein